MPDVDEEQNIEIMASWENGTHTAVTIRRKRRTCNADDMDLQKVSRIYILEHLHPNTIAPSILKPTRV